MSIEKYIEEAGIKFGYLVTVFNSRDSETAWDKFASFLRTSLEEYGREVLENQEWYKKTYLDDYRKVVIDKCIEELPDSESKDSGIKNREGEMANYVYGSWMGFNTCLEEVKEKLNNLK
jgi:hypothetical protein